jgi:cellulose synthase/poly-beta-1,6-N-acetylglucosamine synthase-like glycosyltransferase
MDLYDALILLLLATFVGTQGMYLLGGLVVDWLVVFGARQTVQSPAQQRDEPLTVLVTLYQEPQPIIEETLAHLAEQHYDLANVRVLLVYEDTDPIVTEYIDDIVATNTHALNLDAFAVDHTDEPLLERMRVNWPLDRGQPTPRTKAFALASVYHSVEFDDDDIVTVFDADTLVSPDLFALAVAGLTEYDIVQAKQTIRNIDDGWLPKLEAMGMAAWSDIIYPRTARGPYQLLGKGYFMRARTLDQVNGWQPDEITEDMAFGVAAYKQGLSLGVLDSYIQDLCPSETGFWIRQKRRWLGGPYRVLGRQPLAPTEKARLIGVTMVNQAVSLNTLLGLPAGIAVMVLLATGYELSFPLWLRLLIGFNLVNWSIYSLAGYRATLRGVEFSSLRQKLWFFVVSNPLTQAVYAGLWSVPLLLAAWDYLTGAPEVFDVTPKRLSVERGQDD